MRAGAGEELDQEGAAHRRDGQADAQDTGHQASLPGRDLVGQHRDRGGLERAEARLGAAPPDQDDRDAGGHGNDQDAERPPTRPIIIQGRRIPNRDVVRSLSRPKSGLPTSATRLPSPVTRPRLAGARSIPTNHPHLMLGSGRNGWAATWPGCRRCSATSPR